MKRLICILLLGCSILATTYGQEAKHPARIPAYPGPIERVQPDGDTIIVRLYGDERSHYMTTEDHFLVTENNKGTICYARIKKNGTTVATCQQAHNKNNRSRCEKRFLQKKGILKTKQ